MFNTYKLWYCDFFQCLWLYSVGHGNIFTCLNPTYIIFPAKNRRYSAWRALEIRQYASKNV